MTAVDDDRRMAKGAQAPKTALVTGASSGIGKAFAEVFAAHGYSLIITARREDHLNAVADRLRQEYRVAVHVIPEDLARADGSARLCEEVDRRGLTVDALVNNAGYGVPGSYTQSSWARHSDFLNVLVVSVAHMTHHYLPAMLERGFGRIVNVASLAGLVPAPAGHTLYAASKSFLIRFSEALSQEVRERGVHVTAVCPGFTYSEFHDVTGTRQTVSKLPAYLWLDAKTVAEAGYAAVSEGTPVYVTGRVNRAIAFLARAMPQSLVTAANRRASKRYRKT